MDANGEAEVITVHRFFFFQAEDGIRDRLVTGVQTCALPIFGGMLAGALVTGVLMALFMANAGGAWDNAKKAIEQGHIEGASKGDATHDAAVIGDTIGDPFKDTSGPSLNILIKLMSIVAVVIAPGLSIDGASLDYVYDEAVRFFSGLL